MVYGKTGLQCYKQHYLFCHDQTTGTRKRFVIHKENSQLPPTVLVVAGQHVDHRQDGERRLPLSLGYRGVENDALCHQRFIEHGERIRGSVDS